MGHVSILLDEMGLDKMGLDEMGINHYRPIVHHQRMRARWQLVLREWRNHTGCHNRVNLVTAMRPIVKGDINLHNGAHPCSERYTAGWAPDRTLQFFVISGAFERLLGNPLKLLSAVIKCHSGRSRAHLAVSSFVPNKRLWASMAAHIITSSRSTNCLPRAHH